MAICDAVRSEKLNLERHMNGRIVRYHERLGLGVIATDDGGRYRFAKGQIRNANRKLVGVEVDFLVESRRPKDIIVLQGTAWAVFGS